ncbi:hypothetical protein LUZ61_017214 [Rhynchospora tenuis]|uniref:KIB1-4 beta-propeller domain-containing protein n=1 Tax=Rhynchospora tenuis TaxID=198213 RepID=A0AAD6EKS5_9POAL|nr:hypothetical protein LUZ61_017214 [Rhynchospora tenuis]
MLLQPQAQDSEVCYFYSIVKGKVHKIHVPELNKKWIIGSWRGWLATIDYHDVNQIGLLNPITKAQINLPPLSTLPEPITCSLNVQKIVVVSPNKVDVQSNCVIVALITEAGVLHICKIGDDKWEKIYPSMHCIMDVIEFKGLLHAVDDSGNLFVVQTSPFTKLTPVAVNLNCHGDRLYLVESSGDLLLVSRNLDNAENTQYMRTTNFNVYSMPENKIFALDNLDCEHNGRVLFICYWHFKNTISQNDQFLEGIFSTQSKSLV